MSRAQNILWENRETIENMMQQMDDFADAHGGYINRSGVGNFRTQPKVEEEDKKKKEPMSRGRRQARAAGIAGAGLGAAYLAGKGTPGGEAAKKGLHAAGRGIEKALHTASKGDSLTAQGLRGAGKALKTAAQHYGLAGQGGGSMVKKAAQAVKNKATTGSYWG